MPPAPSRSGSRLRHRAKKPARSARLFSLGALLALSFASAQADTLNWDPTNSGTPPNGGSGNWDLTSAFWLNSSGMDVAWPNSGTDVAAFTTANAGTVTTTAAIQAN